MNNITSTKSKTLLLLVFLGTLVGVNSASADTMDLIGTWTWSGTNSSAVGYTFSGSATFYNLCIGSSCPAGTDELEIVVQNTASSPAATNPEMLGGFMFNVGYTSGAPGALSMLSATATTGLYDSTGALIAGSANSNICAPGSGGTSGVNPGCSSTVTGGWEAGYTATGISPTDAPGSKWGIGSAGFSSAGPGGTGVFNGSSVGNVDYEIAPSSGVSINGKNNYPMVDTSATFVFTGLTAPITSVSSVYAWYGTAPDAFFSGQAQVTTPEPTSLLTLATGGGALVALGWLRRKRFPFQA